MPTFEDPAADPRPGSRTPAAAWSRRAWIWIPPLALSLLQVGLTANEGRMIRAEEMDEAVRSVFWLEHRLIFDGASTNVAWYAFLLGVYRVFGFGLTAAKWARAALLAASLCALSALLHRHLDRLAALAVLTGFAASPSLLYFNRLATSYGTDILFLPFCLLALDGVRLRSRSPGDRGSPLLAACCGALAMIAGMSYPAFLPAWPFLALWLLWLAPPGRRARHALAAGVGFLAPLGLALLAVREPMTLLWDPVEHTGIFRGGGVGWVHQWGPFASNATRVLRDLFVEGDSYYFRFRLVEFGGWAGALGFAAVVVLAIVAARREPASRPLLATGAAAAALTLTLVSLGGGPPGLRRTLVVLAGFQVIVATLWRFRDRLSTGRLGSVAAAVALLALPLHHLATYPRHLGQARHPIWGLDRVWLSVEDTPAASLDFWQAHVAAGRPLDCRGFELSRRMTCNYVDIYAPLAGWYLWNAGDEVTIRAIDPRDGSLVVLGPEDWHRRAPPGLRGKGKLVPP